MENENEINVPETTENESAPETDESHAESLEASQEESSEPLEDSESESVEPSEEQPATDTGATESSADGLDASGQPTPSEGAESPIDVTGNADNTVYVLSDSADYTEQLSALSEQIDTIHKDLETVNTGMSCLCFLLLAFWVIKSVKLSMRRFSGRS